MKVITANDVYDGYRKGLRYLHEEGVEENSRNGPVLVSPVPVTTMFMNPRNRVLLDPVRDCNPFFHMMESIWMFAGRNDVKFVAQFNKRMVQFSDDGEEFNAAYGHRWRYWFGRDQIVDAHNELVLNPESRRCVIAMWDPKNDGVGESKDFPCNTHIYFRVRTEPYHNVKALDMTVCNRSNDIYWGLYGANAVHLSMLHELMANSLGLHLGIWYQVSNNYHLYPANLPKPLSELVSADVYKDNPYLSPLWTPHNGHPVGAQYRIKSFLRSCELFCVYAQNGHLTSGFPFLDNVAFPMYRLWETRDLFWADAIRDDVWRQACVEWLERRAAK
jgi:thymidylate synthase